MNEKLKELKVLTEGLEILYVEDNEGLRHNVGQLLQKIFPNVLIAEDGIAGCELFTQKKPKLVIADINMPKMNGLVMAKKIKGVEPDSKIIYITAYSEKKYLFKAIEAGVFRYLPKPAKVNQLIDTLYDAVQAIHYEESKHIFDSQIMDVFNYQYNLIIMFKNNKPVIVNQRFLDFFGVSDLEEFLEKNQSMEGLLNAHENFLYTTKSSTWFETASQNPGKLYHTKILNNNDESRHLIMKLLEVPNKNGTVIVSFDDVTELNLMALYDKDAAVRDKARKDKKTVLKLMKIVRENRAEIKIHNFYRGLTINNPAVIVSIDDEKVIVKTSYSQLKIVKLVKCMVVSSEVFPSAILCKSIKEVDFDQQTITFSDMQLVPDSGVDRENIRLEPEEKHKVTLLLEGKKFSGETSIVDISIVSVKLDLNALPPGMEVGQDMSVSMVLYTSIAPININTPARIYRIEEFKRSYHLVLKFELHGNIYKQLHDYLAQRQMALIREFKALEIKS